MQKKESLKWFFILFYLPNKPLVADELPWGRMLASNP